MSMSVLRAVAMSWIVCGAARAACATAPIDSGGAVGLFRPVAAKYRLVDGFGFRRHPILGVLRAHEGVDYAAPAGTEVTSAARGEIIEAQRKGEFGNYILVRHADGVETEYAHLSRFAAGIKPGVCIAEGAVIGYVGTTGLSSEPHLHMGLRIADSLVDPIPHMKSPTSEPR